MRARWKGIIIAETMVCKSHMSGEEIHHARRWALHEESMRIQGIGRISGAWEAITRRRQVITYIGHHISTRNHPMPTVINGL